MLFNFSFRYFRFSSIRLYNIQQRSNGIIDSFLYRSLRCAILVTFISSSLSLALNPSYSFSLHFSSLKWHDYQSSLARFPNAHGGNPWQQFCGRCALIEFFFFFFVVVLSFGVVLCWLCDQTEIQHQFHWIHSVYTFIFNRLISNEKRKCCTARQTFFSYPLDHRWSLSSQQNVLQLEALLLETYSHTQLCIRYSVFPNDNCPIALVFKHITVIRTTTYIPKSFVCIQQHQMNVCDTSIHVSLFESSLWIIYQWHTELRRYWFLSLAV